MHFICIGSVVMARKKTLPLEPLTGFFIFMGILPPRNVANTKKLHIIKIVVIVFVFTVSNIATFITRVCYLKRPVIYRMIDGFTNVLVWKLVIGTLCYSYTHKEVFYHLFKELANFRGDAPQQRRILIYFAVLNVYLLVVWLWYYTPPGFKITRRYIIGCISYFQQEIIFFYYCHSASFMAIILLLTFKKKYQYLNSIFLKIRFTNIYDENLLSQVINQGQNMFMRLGFALKMFSEVLTPVLVFLPMVSLFWLLLFCFYSKHVAPVYAGTLSFQIASLLFPFSLVVCTTFYKLFESIIEM